MLSDDGRRVAFWVAADACIGGGHIMRCLCLAEALTRAGAQCEFFVNEAATRTAAALARAPYRQTIVEHDAHKLVSVAKPHTQFDWIIIDDYRLDASSETPLRAIARRIMVIDDLADRPHDCDLLLDSLLGQQAQAYNNLVPKSAIKLIGSDYALVRSEFAMQRSAALARRRETRRPRSILVSFGLMDPGGIAAEAAAAITAAFPRVPIRLVLGAAAGSMAEAKAVAAASANLKILVDPSSMSDLMASSDIAVGASGSTAWERACLGLPTVAVILARNQEALARAFECKKGAVAISRDTHLWKKVGDAIRRMMAEPEYWQEISNKASEICDGLGAVRTALRLFPETAKDGSAITLRPATWEDCDLILSWQNEPGARRFSINSQPPLREEHEEWMRRKLADPDCIMNIIELRGEQAGVLRFDRRRDHSFIVSILVAATHNGKGVAAAALRAGERLLENQTLWAIIDDQNAASLRAFAKAGFLPRGCGKYEYPGKVIGAPF